MKHDIVYILKADCDGEELRYSLRSLENFPHGKVWFICGKPQGLKPDGWMKGKQVGETKWRKVANSIRRACRDQRISDPFWLFNDDFFILDKEAQDQLPLIGGTLDERISEIETRWHGMTAYSEQLRRVKRALRGAGLPSDNYATHTPILIWKDKALEAARTFSMLPMFRSLYGNYWHLRGSRGSDVKIYDMDKLPAEDWSMCSTTNDSFRYGEVGRWLRDRFPNPCKYEERSCDDD